MEEVLAAFKSFRGTNNTARRVAEEQINLWHTQPGFSTVLLQILLNSEIEQDSRQFAGINLKLLCKSHWLSIDDKFQPPELSPTEKEELKAHLPNALSDPSNHIRTTAATVIATIAGWDWPEKWPRLVENLAMCLQHEDLNLVHGAMKTLDMFASGKNLTDLHIPLLVDVVFPQLQRIFAEQSYPERIRMRAVRILFSIVNWLGLVKSVYGQATSQALKPALPGWYALFQNELSKPDEYGVGHGSKIGVLQTLYKLVVDFPEYLKTSLPDLLEPLWNSFISSADIWEKVAVYGTERDMSGYDSDAGDEIGFKNYLCMLVEVFTAIDERRRMQPLLSHGLIDLNYVVIRLMQLTEDQVELYEMDPSAYLMQEDEEDPSTFSIRSQSSRLLQVLASSLEGSGIEAFQAATVRHLDESDQDVQKDSPIWWKKREALLYAVGIALKSWAEASADFGDGNTNLEDVPFDVSGIVATIAADCEHPNIILRGRALWCAGIAVKMLPETAAVLRQDDRPESTHPQIKHFVTAATVAMQTPDAPLPYQLHAAACVTELSPLLDFDTLQTSVSTLLPCLASLAPDLEEASLLGLLETMEGWIDLDPAVTTVHAPVIMTNLMEAWSRNAKNPYVQGLVSVCIQALCRIPEVLPLAQEQVGAALQHIFADIASRDNGLIEAATDNLGHLILDAPWPLPTVLSENLVPALFTQMLITVDNAMLQTGCTTLVALVRCAKQNLAEWPLVVSVPTDDGSGSFAGPEQQIKASALDFILQIIDRIMNAPYLNDHAAICLGPLISKAIDTCSDALGDRSASILQSVVLRMARSELPTLIQAFLQVFALLIRQNMSLVLEFLCGFQMPNGETALTFVLSLWTKTFEERHGSYQIKVSLLALSSIFNQAGLENVMVPTDAAIEDALIDAEEVIGSRTRSKQKQKPAPAAPRTEPLNTRIFKLLLREHMWLLEENNAPAHMSSDEDYVGFEAEEAYGEGESPFALASEYAGVDGEDYGGAISLDKMLSRRMQVGGDEETDPDILNDPAYALDPEQFIYDWMKNLATENVELFEYCVSQVSPMERNHLIQNLIGSRQ